MQVTLPQREAQGDELRAGEEECGPSPPAPTASESSYDPRVFDLTAMITTIDLDGLYGRSWDHESLLRRPTPESSRGCRAAWHVQVRDRPPVLHQPLLGQALHQTRRPRGASYPKEGRRKAPH